MVSQVSKRDLGRTASIAISKGIENEDFSRAATDLWPSMLDWPAYETYIFGALLRLNPGAVVRQNAHLMGQSGRSRQIDVLVERNTGNLNLKIAVDSKCYKRKVNTKHVEAFLGCRRTKPPLNPCPNLRNHLSHQQAPQSDQKRAGQRLHQEA